MEAQLPQLQPLNCQTPSCCHCWCRSGLGSQNPLQQQLLYSATIGGETVVHSRDDLIIMLHACACCLLSAMPPTCVSMDIAILLVLLHVKWCMQYMHLHRSETGQVCTEQLGSRLPPAWVGSCYVRLPGPDSLAAGMPDSSAAQQAAGHTVTSGDRIATAGVWDCGLMRGRHLPAQ